MSRSTHRAFPLWKKADPLGGCAPHRIAVCSKCGSKGWWRDNTASGAPDEMVAAGFRNRNWEMDAKGRGVCPTCRGLKRTKPRLTPAQKQAAFLRITAEERARETITEVPAPTTQPEETVMVHAEPPRQPTREDRRRIQDELDLVYSVDLQRYKSSWTDDALAAKLIVPRAWISEERDRAYGPAGNDADIERMAALQLLAERVATAGDAAMKAAEHAMAAADEAEKLVAELKAKLGEAA